jgi:ATP-dependent Clp endopeptidase proteolytic subunit ClpP
MYKLKGDKKMPKKKIVISGIIGGWGLEPEDIRAQLTEAAGEDIEVEINSPGGYVYDGLEIYHMFKKYSGNVHFHVMGLAASMASIIPLAGNKITAEETTVWMIHNPMGYLFGANYKEAQKFADYLKGIANLLANVYAKKTEKDISDIQSLMDEDTYFFGEEAKEFGLVDEIIEIEKENTSSRDDTLAYAQLEIEECVKKMKKHIYESGKKEDLDKIAAFIDISNTENIDAEKFANYLKGSTNFIDIINTENLENNNDKLNKNPAKAGKNKMEVKDMTLDQILAENPAIKIELENRLREKFEAGKVEGKEEVSKRIEKASKYFGSEYPDKIKAIAAEVIIGEKSLETLEAVVTVYDVNIENANSNNAADDQQPDTPGQQPSPMADTGIASTVDDVASMVASDKGGI